MTDEPVDRGLSGGSIRQSYLFEALASAFPTDLLIAGEAPDERVRRVASEVIELPTRRSLWTTHPIGRRLLTLAIAFGSRYPLPVYPTYPARRVLARSIRERQHEYDLVCIEHEALAPLLPSTRSGRWIVTFHHVLSGMIKSDVELAPGKRQRWYREQDMRKALALEQRAVQSFDRCVVCSDEDASTLAAVAGPGAADHISVVPNGVDLSRFPPSPVPAEPQILFPGNLAYAPNVDGAAWFCSEIWPRVVTAVPNVTLKLVGRHPDEAVLALADLPGVSVHPNVPSMVPYFESARVVLVPLRLGTGTRLKALEAMGAGRPVVGTTEGLAGIGVVDGVQARVADDPETLASAVIDVLQRDDIAQSLGQAGREYVKGRFEWDRIGADFVAMVRELLDMREPSSSMAAPGKG